MINKFSLLFIILLILNSCGYEPVYSKKNLNFSIGNIEKNNTSLNNKFSQAIKNFSKGKETNKINIRIQSKKEISIKSKDTKGNSLVFELKLTLKIKNLDKSDIKERTFTKKINYKNSDDKFKLQQYENELEKILITKLVEDLINYLSSIQ
tara:strand:+ start:48 stop:500 length:453 start_codon:yes stop_codon:yes gene_type:complete